MNIAVILAALCVACVAAQHRRCALVKEIVESYKKCVEIMNPDEETIKLIHDREGLDNEKANCFRHCILKEAGLMENAVFNFPRMIELLNSCGRKHSDKREEMVQTLRSCQKDAEASDNECTVAGKYAECAHNNMPRHGRGHRGEEPE